MHTLRRDLTPVEIRSFRVSQGWNQEAMAAELRVNKITISRAECGQVGPLFSSAVWLLWRSVVERIEADKAANRPLENLPPPLPKD